MMWARGGRRHGGGGARNAPNAALLLTLLQRINSLDRKPPLTLGLMGLMYALHFQKTSTPLAFRAYSLCPDKVVHSGDGARLLASAFLHVDDWHLYHNMASLLWKGYNLEHQLGTVRFGVAVAYLLVLSQVLVVVVTFALATLFHIHEPFYQCSVGFSGVLFALKVLLNHNAPTFSSVYGIRVPTKYAAWLELAMIHVLVPRSSFMGHMCGIVAGYIYVLSPGLQHSGAWIARFFQRWYQLVAMPPSPPASPRAAEHQNGHSSATSQSRSYTATTHESDAMLARRLQDEEYRAAGLHGSNGASTTAHDTPAYISQDELRRRRVERLQRESRW